jgi:hypothetical protein
VEEGMEAEVVWGAGRGSVVEWSLRWKWRRRWR